MPGYTIKNLMDIEDSAAGRATGIEARFARKHIDSEHLGVTYMRYAPDTRAPMGHSHREQEEVYVVVAGSGRIKLDDTVEELRRWDVVRISPTTVRALESGPDGLEVLAIGSDRPPDGDGVRGPEDFWPPEA
jgi:mannose-6-phosphate isomerase-like protein (cupin superfamily)